MEMIYQLQRDPLEEEINTLIGLQNFGISIREALSMPATRYDIIIEQIEKELEENKRNEELEKVKMNYGRAKY
jgi:hypothetical protein